MRLFHHIKENQLFYRTYFKLGYDNQFKLGHYDIYQAKQHFDNQYIEYHIEFFRSGLNAIVKKWLAGGCKETPEEMESIIRSEYQGRSEL
ncbi:TetR-like C-terminal domain-containing protein [Oscillibacter sp. PC13]|uniref:TetR-like C-terminal domain-containing protein n=1 Tax=Oscillibacter sp. PC13 TaxID=1855299 RepID=UPI000AC11281